MSSKVVTPTPPSTSPQKHASDGMSRSQPILGQKGKEIQSFGSVIRMPIGLDEGACRASTATLNQILADTMALRDLYKKSHWQVSGPTFYQLHLLFDKHYQEQAELVDTLAERVQMLGGVSVAMAHDVAETTQVSRAPRGRRRPPRCATPGGP